jgi:hypothetical protein
MKITNNIVWWQEIESQGLQGEGERNALEIIKKWKGPSVGLTSLIAEYLLSDF